MSLSTRQSPATPNGPLTSSCYLPTACYQFCQAYGPNIHAGFVYWQPAFGWGLIYAMPEKEHVKALKYDIPEKRIEETPVAQSDVIVPDGMPGGACLFPRMEPRTALSGRHCPIALTQRMGYIAVAWSPSMPSICMNCGETTVFGTLRNSTRRPSRTVTFF